MQKSEKIHINANIFSLCEKYKIILRFLIVGSINTGVDFLGFMTLYSLLGFEKLLCQLVAFGLGIINSFLLNKLWIFENKSTKFDTANQIIKFIAINAVSLGASILVLKALSDGAGLNIYASKVIATCVSLVSNYIGYKLWVFK